MNTLDKVKLNLFNLMEKANDTYQKDYQEVNGIRIRSSDITEYRHLLEEYQKLQEFSDRKEERERINLFSPTNKTKEIIGWKDAPEILKTLTENNAFIQWEKAAIAEMSKIGDNNLH